MDFLKSKYLFSILFFIFFCKEAENPYIPTPDIFKRDFTQTIPENYEIESELREILNTNNLFCENSFRNKKLELNGENDNIFVSELERINISAYVSIYKQKIQNRPDIFILKSRCCPMGPCYTSYFFQKKSSGEWELFDTIPGEVIDFKKTKDLTTIKIHDQSLTGLMFIGSWKEKEFEPLLAFRQMNIDIPKEFTQTKKILQSKKEINLLKKPKEYHIDNLAFRVSLPAEANIYILSESENHYFILVKATSAQLENVLENFRGERESLVSQIQALPAKYKNAKDLKTILEKTFYNIGWVEKF
ncbi:MAG: hypothetical protein IPL26_17255 [Leptospiraceae bacterium]|nr:hypothetical protein [Leptospiraceae bacterium]